MGGYMPTGRSSTTVTPPANILIVDDHELARSGLRSLLEREPGVAFVGEASNGREALDLCSARCPDLILMDLHMPEMDGLTAARAIKQICPRTRIIIVTLHANPDYLLEALNAGVAGYLLKDATRREVIAAVHQVLHGEAFLNNDLVLQTLRRMAAEPAATTTSSVEPLTARELEVLRLLVQGKTNREIGSELVISTGTVKVHVEHIIGKLGVSDRTQAAVRAIETGLLK
jgi:DNA-binding NarL/FixJ family response regulator